MTPGLETRNEHHPEVRVGSMAPEALVVSVASRSFAPERFQWAAFLAVTSVALLADQLLKNLVGRTLALGEDAPLPGPFSLEHVRNSGVAFGFFSSFTSVVALVTAFVVGGLFLYFARAGATHPLLPIALGLLAGGSISNLADRVRMGYVTDYLEIRFWPSFNLADAFIVAGVTLLLTAWTAADLRGSQ